MDNKDCRYKKSDATSTRGRKGNNIKKAFITSDGNDYDDNNFEL